MTKRKVFKSIYGKIALLKAYCVYCRAYSFIRDSRFICCNAEYENIPARIYPKREAIIGKRKTISGKVKQHALEAQGHRCIYCDCELQKSAWDDRRGKWKKVKIHFDHFVPWNTSGDSSAANIVAACQPCNQTKSNLYFRTLDEARLYILQNRGLIPGSKAIDSSAKQ